MFWMRSSPKKERINRMDPNGHIYELTKEEQERLKKPRGYDQTSHEAEVREDVARLEGYLKGRAEGDISKRGKGANKDLSG